MNQDIYERIPVQGDEAIFLPPEPCLWDLRQAAKRAILGGKETQRFTVVQMKMYYPGMLDQLLGVPGRLQKESLMYNSAIVGEKNGSLRCVLLWEDNHEGLLLHGNGGMLLCAYAPVVTESLVRKEHELALTLTALADHAADISVALDRMIMPGKYTLRDLLHHISKQMDT